MRSCMHVAHREMKVGFRNPWAYSFMALFSVFMGSLLLINAQGYVSGYAGTTGTMLNLILYLLPLMTLMLGSFSLTGEKEDGHWALLSTYPISTWSFLVGKFLGLTVIMLLISAVGFGFSGVLGWFAGTAMEFSTFLHLLFFTFCLSVMFLAISMVIGTLSRNRWQALTIAVALWFFLIIAWAPILIAVLGMLPYGWVKPILAAVTLLNPAELSRLFTIVKLGGGTMAGPEYYEWMSWVQQPAGTLSFCAFLLLWTIGGLALSYAVWERRRTRG